MSYNYTTKIKVSALSQIPTTDLNDEWSDWVEALIDEYVGESYTGLTTHTAEKHDGDGSGILGVGGDGEELRLSCSDPVAGNIRISYSYYTIES